MADGSTSQRTPASVDIAIALASTPAALKEMWHKVGESLTCCQFAYLVSSFVGAMDEMPPALEGRTQEELLAGVAELFTETTVSQADKSTISWRAFSQSLVAAMQAAGRPPRVVTDARLTQHRVTIEGEDATKKSLTAVKSSGYGEGRVTHDLPSLTISSETALYHLLQSHQSTSKLIYYFDATASNLKSLEAFFL